LSILAVFSVFLTVLLSYWWGFQDGIGWNRLESQNQLFSSPTLSPVVEKIISPHPSPTSKVIPVISPKFNWGGPELWEAVNKARVEHGVNPLKQADELCTLASIRLNELLALGKLDGHEGFANLPERRPDLKWIFEKYDISEFLIQGAPTAEEAVKSWLNTLGHKKILTGGEYVWGCTYAQEGFGVAIAAY